MSWFLVIQTTDDRKDALSAELWESGTTGIVEEDEGEGRVVLKAFFDEQAPDAAERFGGEWRAVADRDWIEVARSQWQPVLVGGRFFLVPVWRDEPTPEGRIRIEIDSGMACGTGWHPATQLALEAMERSLRPGDTVFDLGTGSGILSVAAARLGAGQIVACDIDGQAVALAAQRLRADGIEAALFTGSARAVASGSVDLVVANINAEAILQLLTEITRVLKPGGRAILSGFNLRGAARLRPALGAEGLPIRASLEKEDWIAFLC
jgi:ribosomal protein L11 methyltransferase